MKKSTTMYAIGWAGYHMLNPSPLVTGPYALFVNKTNAEEFESQVTIAVKWVVWAFRMNEDGKSERRKEVYVGVDQADAQNNMGSSLAKRLRDEGFSSWALRPELRPI